MIQTALEGVTVLDLTHYIAGPYATRLLAEYGADVIKIERRDGGDGSRRAGPFPNGEPHIEKSGLFLHLNAGSAASPSTSRTRGAPRSSSASPPRPTSSSRTSIPT